MTSCHSLCIYYVQIIQIINVDHFYIERLSLILVLQMSNILVQKNKEVIIYLAGGNNYVISGVLSCAENFLLIIT